MTIRCQCCGSIDGVMEDEASTCVECQIDWIRESLRKDSDLDDDYITAANEELTRLHKILRGQS